MNLSNSKVLVISIIDIISTENYKKSCNTIDYIIKYINIHYNDDLILENIYNKFNINICYFCKKSKEKTGITYMSYLTNIRITKAKDLLLKSDYNINEIAKNVGFKDSNLKNTN